MAGPFRREPLPPLSLEIHFLTEGKVLIKLFI